MLPTVSSTCSLIQLRVTCLGVASPTVGWALPHQLIKKICHRFAHKSIWGVTHFLSRGSPSQMCLGLCLFGKNQSVHTIWSTPGQARSGIDIILQFKGDFQDIGNQMLGIVWQSPLAFPFSTVPETLNVLNKQCSAMLLKVKLLTRTIMKLQKRKQFNLSKIFSLC